MSSARSLRVLIIQETNWVERNVIHQHHLGERLVRRGHQLEVIDYDILWPQKKERVLWRSRQVFPNLSRVVEGASLSVTRPFTIHLPLLCHASWALSSLLELRREIQERRPDVVVGLSLTNSYFLGLMLRKACIPYVSLVLEPYHTMIPQSWARRPAKSVERLAMRQAGRVVVFTPQMRQYVQEMGVKPENVEVLKTGISLDCFLPGLDGSAARASLGLGPQDWVLFFMGWLYDFSGLREIIRAIVGRPELLEGAKLLIVGDGDLYPELAQLVTQADLQRQVILTGKRPYREIPSLVAAADVCLLPSLENSTTRDIVPMKVYEYLACGKPVVASRLPGLLAEFGEGNGLIYTGHPLEALKRAVDLRSEKRQLETISSAGRRFSEQNADWEKTTLAFEKMLLSVLNEFSEKVQCTALT